MQTRAHTPAAALEVAHAAAADPPARLDASAIAKPIRIEPAFDNREFVRALFDRHAPYRAVAAYLPDGSDDTVDSRPADTVNPWFRGTWALGGKVLIQGAETILANRHFLAAARTLFPSARIVPKLVVVNVNGPMPAGVPHVDVPVFRGATRETFALRLLMAMGASGLFERWRVVEVGAVAWFYDGPGGGFEYWPDGPEGSMRTVSAPFGNVAIVADADRMYHRIGRIGPVGAEPPRMSANAEIRTDADGGWSIFEADECRARYRKEAVRLSVVWKADVRREGSGSVEPAPLTPSHVLQILEHDLCRRGVPCASDLALLQDARWIERLYRLYMRLAKMGAPTAAQ
jgi:hypothetical protein